MKFGQIISYLELDIADSAVTTPARSDAAQRVGVRPARRSDRRQDVCRALGTVRVGARIRGSGDVAPRRRGRHRRRSLSRDRWSRSIVRLPAGIDIAAEGMPLGERSVALGVTKHM